MSMPNMTDTTKSLEATQKTLAYPNITADELASAIVTKMKEEHHTLWIDAETHSNQHAFVEALIQERADRVRRRKVIEDKIAGSIILSMIIGTITLVGAGTLNWARDHLK